MNLRPDIGADRAALTAVAMIAIDQGTKSLAFSAAQEGEEVNFIPAVTISQTRNEGIAFGMFSGQPWVVFGLMCVALTVLIWFYARHRSRPVLWLATGLLLGGAVGNAIDRVRLGYVRDFINLPSWPSFNIADISITIGVMILVFTADRAISHDDEAEQSDEGDNDAPVAARTDDPTH
ncbi:MAG: signal peptidase II [Solirubrobacterales bacterium]